MRGGLHWMGWLALLGVLVHASIACAESRRLEFPRSSDGREVLAVDLHAHTVFSDGDVWPTVRVDEAVREGLAGIAITDHVEFQPKLADIPNADKNRPYEIARNHAGQRVHVINGAEITRRMPPGHFIATFLADANAVLTAPSTASVDELKSAPAYGEADSFLRALTAARSQGAFVFWAHPVDAPTDVSGPVVQPLHERVIAAGLVQGVEVANPHWGFMRAGLEIALEYDLAILAVSDVHRTIEQHNRELGNLHRGVTLVLSKDRSLEAIANALRDKATVALYNETFIGRARELAPLIEGLLSVEVLKDRATPADDRVLIRIENRAPVAMRLRPMPSEGMRAVFDQVDLAPGEHRDLGVRMRHGQAFTGIDLQIANALTGVDDALEIALRVDAASR